MVSQSHPTVAFEDLPELQTAISGELLVRQGGLDHRAPVSRLPQPPAPVFPDPPDVQALVPFPLRKALTVVGDSQLASLTTNPVVLLPELGADKLVFPVAALLDVRGGQPGEGQTFQSTSETNWGQEVAIGWLGSYTDDMNVVQARRMAWATISWNWILTRARREVGDAADNVFGVWAATRYWFNQSKPNLPLALWSVVDVTPVPADTEMHVWVYYHTLDWELVGTTPVPSGG